MNRPYLNFLDLYDCLVTSVTMPIINITGLFVCLFDLAGRGLCGHGKDRASYKVSFSIKSYRCRQVEFRFQKSQQQILF